MRVSPFLKAAAELRELVIRQSCSLLSWNQTNACTSGSAWIWVKKSSIHRALLPPISVLATSLMSRGLEVSARTARMVGRKMVS